MCRTLLTDCDPGQESSLEVKLRVATDIDVHVYRPCIGGNFTKMFSLSL